VATVRYGSRDPAREGCGAPLESIEVRIVDGAIQVRGPTLFSSYLPDTGRPLLEGGWFETEDLGEIDEAGRLWVHGRRDELIVTGGENVHPRELESVLERHPAIERACAFGIPDETWGQLVAVALVCEPARRPSIAEIRGFVESALAAFKRPRRVAFLNELAESPTGKLDRRQIAELARKTLIPIE
jgi:O-succinylbenzoic acid--CoA ligase